MTSDTSDEQAKILKRVILGAVISTFVIVTAMTVLAYFDHEKTKMHHKENLRIIEASEKGVKTFPEIKERIREVEMMRAVNEAPTVFSLFRHKDSKSKVVQKASQTLDKSSIYAPSCTWDNGSIRLNRDSCKIDDSVRSLPMPVSSTTGSFSLTSCDGTRQHSFVESWKDLNTAYNLYSSGCWTLSADGEFTISSRKG